ncbi:MAG: 3-phosphoshikimate 1-carboxyvinyltransferase [Calditrichaeota bacterium]|nr:MAG: 3-phosphoshikimate 1-carboxyvinyltransferase [Calditrichota bacterium]
MGRRMKPDLEDTTFLPEAVALQPGRLAGQVDIPPSKSISHRLMILGALSRQPVTIDNLLWCQDTEVTYRALQAMGYLLDREGQRVVCRGWESPGSGEIPIHLGESGSSARFLLAVAARTPGRFLLDGALGLRRRPVKPLIEALRQLGARIEAPGDRLPATVYGGNLRGGRVALDASASSQFVTALLLVAPFLPEGLEVHWQGQVASYPYVELTLSLLKQAGVAWEEREVGIRVAGSQPLKQQRFFVEADFSNASYFLAGALIGGGEVICRGLSPQSAQGDRAIESLLRAMGGQLSWVEGGLLARGGAALNGLEVNMQAFPDLVPTLAVTALFAGSPSHFAGIRHLAVKESNRIRSVAENILRLGGEVQAGEDSLVVKPAGLRGALLPAYGDHRIAMAFSLAGLRVPGVIIDQADSVAKSFPHYWRDFFAVYVAAGPER